MNRSRVRAVRVVVSGDGGSGVRRVSGVRKVAVGSGTASLHLYNKLCSLRSGCKLSLLRAFVLCYGPDLEVVKHVQVRCMDFHFTEH